MGRLSFIPLLAALAVAAGPQDRSANEPTPEERRQQRIRQLIDEIELRASVESPQLAISTYLRAASMLRASRTERALTMLEAAKVRLGGFSSERAKASFQSLVGQEFADLDPAQAEELCLAIPPEKTTLFESDPKSACWSKRISKENNLDVRMEASLRALADGAYSTSVHAGTVASLQKKDPEKAAEFLSAYLRGFQEKTAGLSELRGLVGVLRAVGPDQQALAREGLETAVRSIEREDFPEPKEPLRFEARIDGRTIKTSGAGDTLAFQLADLAWMLAPDLLESHPESLGKWKSTVSSGDWQRRRVTRFRESNESYDAGIRKMLGLEDLQVPDLDRVNSKEAEALLGTLTDPNARALVLLQLLTESGKAEDRTRLIGEIHKAIEKMPDDSRSKLFALFFLFDESLVRNDFQAAAEYGKQMVQAFNLTLNCSKPACEEASIDFQPGDLLFEFAEYVHGRGVAPASVGVSHVSVEARLKLLELKELLEAKSRRDPQRQ